MRTHPYVHYQVYVSEDEKNLNIFKQKYYILFFYIHTTILPPFSDYPKYKIR